MNPQQEWSLILRLIAALRGRSSWCGETHIQKTSYFIKCAGKVPMSSEFVLYKHGPYSFDLHQQLNLLQACGQIRVEAQRPPYGPRLAVTEEGTVLAQRIDPTNVFGRQIDYYADQLASKKVSELEKLATALWFRELTPGQDIGQIAEQINAVKPHISVEAGVAAVEELQQIS